MILGRPVRGAVQARRHRGGDLERGTGPALTRAGSTAPCSCPSSPSCRSGWRCCASIRARISAWRNSAAPRSITCRRMRRAGRPGAGLQGFDRQGEGPPGHSPGEGHDVAVPEETGGVARFTFADLCAQPLGASDYMAVGPRLPHGDRLRHPRDGTGQPQRGQTLHHLVEHPLRRPREADRLGDRRAAEPLHRHRGREPSNSDRTVSRLIEMRSSEYLALPHGAGDSKRPARAPVSWRPEPTDQDLLAFDVKGKATREIRSRSRRVLQPVRNGHIEAASARPGRMTPLMSRCTAARWRLIVFIPRYGAWALRTLRRRPRDADPPPCLRTASTRGRRCAIAPARHPTCDPDGRLAG